MCLLYESVPLGRGMFVYMTVCHYFYVCICISVNPYGRICENPNLCLYMPVSVDVSVCGIASGCYEMTLTVTVLAHLTTKYRHFVGKLEPLALWPH